MTLMCIIGHMKITFLYTTDSPSMLSSLFFSIPKVLDSFLFKIKPERGGNGFFTIKTNASNLAYPSMVGHILIAPNLNTPFFVSHLSIMV